MWCLKVPEEIPSYIEGGVVPGNGLSEGPNPDDFRDIVLIKKDVVLELLGNYKGEKFSKEFIDKMTEIVISRKEG